MYKATIIKKDITQEELDHIIETASRIEYRHNFNGAPSNWTLSSIQRETEEFSENEHPIMINIMNDHFEYRYMR